MVINRLHIRSSGAGHPDFVASKTLGLTDQEPQMQSMGSPLTPVTQGNPETHYNAFTVQLQPPPHTRMGKGCHDQSGANLLGQKLLLTTCGRSPPKDWKQPPLQTTLLDITAPPSPEGLTKNPIPKQPRDGFHLREPARCPLESVLLL